MVALVRQIIKLEDGTELSPNNNSRILAMDWQVSENMNFKDPILKSENDTKNLSSIIFTDILDPNTKWYARARALIKDSGWTVWGNLDVMNYEQATDSFNANIVPTRVSTPILTTSSNVDSHDATLFTIFARGFSVIGNATHSATSWFIEDLNGNIVWSSLEDPVNKTQISFNSMILKNNNIYRIRAMFHSSGNGTSSIASLTVKVGGSNTMELLTYLDDVDFTSSTEVIGIYPDLNVSVDSATWQIISMSNNYAEIIYSVTTMGAGYGTVNIPANLLKQDTNYLLKFKATVGGVETHWKYVQFKTMNTASRATALVVTPNTLVIDVDEEYTSLVISTDDDAILTFSIDNQSAFSYDRDTNTLKGLDIGEGYLTITAQSPDKNATSVNVAVKVKRDVKYSYKAFDQAVFLDPEYGLGAVSITPTTDTYTIPATGKEVTLDTITIAPNEWVSLNGLTTDIGYISKIETIGGNFSVSTYTDGLRVTCNDLGESILLVTLQRDSHTVEYRYIKFIGSDLHNAFDTALGIDKDYRITVKVGWKYDLTTLKTKITAAGYASSNLLAFNSIYGQYFDTNIANWYIKGISAASGNIVEGLIAVSYGTSPTRYRVIPVDVIRNDETYPDTGDTSTDVEITLDGTPLNVSSTVTLEEGSSKLLDITTTGELVHSSTNNSSIAVFDSDGKTLIGVNAGNCTGTVSAKEEGKKQTNVSFNITVTAKVLDPTDLTAEIDGVNLDGYNNLYPGNTATVTLTTDGKVLSIENSDTDVLSYNTDTNVITALKNGTAKITIIVQATGKKATAYEYNVTVKEMLPVEYTITPSGAISMEQNSTITLAIETTADITYTISNGSVINYNPTTKVITGIGVGSSNLVFTFKESNKLTQTATIAVTVIEESKLELTKSAVNITVNAATKGTEILGVTANKEYEVTNSNKAAFSYDKSTKTITAIKEGSGKLTFTMAKLNGSLITRTVNVTVTDNTTLSVSPLENAMSIGETQVLTINTNAPDFTVNTNSATCYTFNKSTKTITATASGSGTLTISVAKADGSTINKNVTIEVITYTFTLDDGTVLVDRGTYEFNSGDVINIVVK